MIGAPETFGEIGAPETFGEINEAPKDNTDRTQTSHGPSTPLAAHDICDRHTRALRP